MNKLIFSLIFWCISFFLLIMGTIDAQETRSIVDSSSLETLSERNPFTPQVPQEDLQTRRVETIKPVKIEAPVVPPPPAARVEVAPVLPPRPEDIRRLPPPEEPLPNMNISGLVWNTDRPQAIINGQITGIGDIISGVKIIDIQKTGITVLFRNKTSTLKIER
ncbi:MAG TPA: hypothetical protein DE315_06845 [Candidatus Omnitrophica bacterium]|nr:MAG: hypothetical protein A2Y05_01605 [Omnitrophica WOR_2 bacterium GWA2_53_43]HBO97724.1 hypothetical protein [Candidatus Omnitrophota bacterium]HCI45228.1 hypothetical protein [Candidatus Omnitrophota bacterium]